MSGRSVLVSLDKERHLRFSVNALSDLEQILGTGLGAAFGAGLVFTTIRAALWAGLRHEDADLTVLGVGDLIQDHLDRGGDFNALGIAVKDALALAGFGGEGEAKSGATAGPFGSGSGSTPLSP